MVTHHIAQDLYKFYPFTYKTALSDLFKDNVKKAHWMWRIIVNELRHVMDDQYLEDIIILCKLLFKDSIPEDEYEQLCKFYTRDIMKVNQVDDDHYSIHMNLSEVINAMVDYIQSNYNYLYSYEYLDMISDIIGEFKIKYNIKNSYQILYNILNEETVIVSEEILKYIEYYLFPQKIEDDESSSDQYNKCEGDQCDINYTNTLSNIYNKRQIDCDDEMPSTKRQKMHRKVKNKYQWNIHIYWNQKIVEPSYLSHPGPMRCMPYYSN
jgi:hypothetical protein